MKPAAFAPVVALTWGLASACGDPAQLDNALGVRALAEAEMWQKRPEELNSAELERLREITSPMSPADLEAQYGATTLGRGLLDEIADAIWGEWERMVIPGAVCANGSPYKVFVYRARDLWSRLKGYDKRLTVYLEGGGACWDYASCTGQTRRGAANLDGIPDNYMSLGDFLDPGKAGGSPSAVMSPLIFRNNPTGDEVETAWWSKVFVPYCTGDVHSGNRVATYPDPTGQDPPLTIRHVGAANLEKVIERLRSEFYRPQEMMVTGCSAGGVGTLTSYHFFRKALAPRRSYMLNDSGPVFPTRGGGNQAPLQNKIREAWGTDWGVDQLEADMPGFDLHGDYGAISDALAATYPNDKLATTLFTRDGNYSAYSYARFYGLDETNPADKARILELWAQDIDRLVSQYDRRPNLSYYIPYYRKIIESHCTTVVEFTGTEYLDTGIDVGDFIRDMLDGGSVTSYREPDNPADALVTSFWLEVVAFAEELLL